MIRGKEKGLEGRGGKKSRRLLANNRWLWHPPALYAVISRSLFLAVPSGEKIPKGSDEDVFLLLFACFD